jgi:chlorite dismutase
MKDDDYSPSTPPPHGTGERPPLVDIVERGAEKQGKPQTLERRLFMQLLVFQTPAGVKPSTILEVLSSSLLDATIPAVVYADVNDPRGFGLLTWSEEPAHFVTEVRPLLSGEVLRDVVLRPEFTMLGRSYSTGFEDDLVFWLLDRPQKTVLNEAWPWAVWYPLRRSGAFARLPDKEIGSVLREHGVIGRAYADKDLAHDVRLACHGLDANDNEFVIGLIGKELHPLSHLVQRMRKTRQTSEFIVQMGPFFVGHAAFRSPGR